MIRSISTEIMFELASKFSFTEVMADTAPRDVLFCPVQLASRARDERVDAESIASKMPFCNFYIAGLAWSPERRNRLVTHGGVRYTLADEGSTVDAMLKSIKLAPVDIEYQIDVWTAANRHTEMMAYVSQWMFWQDLPGHLELTDAATGATVSLGLQLGDPTDNSDLEAMFEKGEVYRYTFPLTVAGYVIGTPETFYTIRSAEVNIYSLLDGSELAASAVVT